MYIHSMKHCAVRLLNRRYDLTVTGYKFLEIGINVGLPSYVEIALEDDHGHDLYRNVEGPLRAATEYLQDAAKRLQG